MVPQGDGLVSGYKVTPCQLLVSEITQASPPTGSSTHRPLPQGSSHTGPSPPDNAGDCSCSWLPRELDGKTLLQYTLVARHVEIKLELTGFFDDWLF